MTTENPFLEFAAILGLAAVLGLLAQRLLQPLVIMLLVTGVVAGPSGFSLIHNHDQLELLAQVGISLLLFIVGLRLDLNLVRTIGPAALLTGLGQLFFTILLGLGLALALGMAPLTATYVAVALAFSSTIIIVKLLSDKKEIDSLHGQLAVGILIVQDIAALLALTVLSALGSATGEAGGLASTGLLLLAKGAGFFLGIYLFVKFVFPFLLHKVATSQELLALAAIAWAVSLAALGESLGFSKEVGAFAAGLALASSEYRDAISVRLATLRDFLLLFFFVDLGARLDWSLVSAQLGAAALFSAFVLLVKPVLVMALMGLLGYRRRTSFLTGLTIAQISEFSLILAAFGLSLGHLSEETAGLFTLVGVITIFVSAYLILYSGPIYERVGKAFRLLEGRRPYREALANSRDSDSRKDVLLVGLGNYGSALAEYLLSRGFTVLGLDFDPAALAKWRAKDLPVHYGDMTDPELLTELPFQTPGWIVSTIRSVDFGLALIRQLRQRAFAGQIAVTAATEADAEILRQAGATVVLRPSADAAEQAADALTHAMALLPTTRNWPVAFKEVRLQTGTVTAGRALRELALRSSTQASVLAVSRGGQLVFDPSPDFRLLPGDRVVLLGEAGELRKAESLLNQPYAAASHETVDRFDMVEIGLGESSDLIGRTLAELAFRQRHNVTVVGIRRGASQLTAPPPTERLQAGDRLVVLGSLEAIEHLQELEPL